MAHGPVSQQAYIFSENNFEYYMIYELASYKIKSKGAFGFIVDFDL